MVPLVSPTAACRVLFAILVLIPLTGCQLAGIDRIQLSERPAVGYLSKPAAALSKTAQPAVHQHMEEVEELLPPAGPVRADYLAYGPVMGPEGLLGHPSATERMLEMQEQMDQLVYSNTELAEHVAQLQQDLETTNERLGQSQQEIMQLHSELADTQSRMNQWQNQLEQLADAIDRNEERHLEQLDQIVDAIRSVIKRQEERIGVGEPELSEARLRGPRGE